MVLFHIFAVLPLSFLSLPCRSLVVMFVLNASQRNGVFPFSQYFVWFPCHCLIMFVVVVVGVLSMEFPMILHILLFCVCSVMFFYCGSCMGFTKTTRTAKKMWALISWRVSHDGIGSLHQWVAKKTLCVHHDGMVIHLLYACIVYLCGNSFARHALIAKWKTASRVHILRTPN